MTRLKAILAAGTLTGVVLATSIGLSVRNITNSNDDEPTIEPTVVTENELTLENVIETQQQQLEVMQAREEQYRAEIEAANQAILELQAELSQPIYVQGAQQAPAAAPASASAAPAASGGEYEDHDEEDEHEDREEHSEEDEHDEPDEPEEHEDGD